MKILILTTSYPRSKRDFWVPFMHSFAKEIAKTHQITVLASDGPGAEKFELRDKVKIYRFTYFLPRRLQRLTYTGGMIESFKTSILSKIQAPFFLLSFFIKSLSLVRKCDIIHAHWTISALVVIPLKKIFKKPIILTVHGGDLRGTPEILSRFIIKHVDVVTSAHQNVIDKIKSFKLNRPIFDIKNMLDYDKFNRKYIRNIKNEFKIKNEKIITFIGRLEPMKDPLTFVRSIPYALSKNNNIKFLVVGDGHLMELVKKEINKLKISEKVIITGPRTDIPSILNSSDIFVASSNLENCFSTTIIEAMTMGVPCVITKAGLSEKFFIHKKYAYLVPMKNPKALGEGISYVLNHTSLRKKLIFGGKEFLKNNGFAREEIIKKFNEIYSGAYNKYKK